jgi:hypothetical protein
LKVSDSPEGAQCDSPWHRHRKRSIIIIASPEGAEYFMSPFQGLTDKTTPLTCGDATGYHIVAPSGLFQTTSQGECYLN